MHVMLQVVVKLPQTLEETSGGLPRQPDTVLLGLLQGSIEIFNSAAHPT